MEGIIMIKASCLMLRHCAGEDEERDDGCVLV